MIRTLLEPRHIGNGYPTSDGRPMAETDLHRDVMFDLIETLKERFAADPLTYVSGNILLFYEPGNKRRHVSPDVLVVLGETAIEFASKASRVPKRSRTVLCVAEHARPMKRGAGDKARQAGDAGRHDLRGLDMDDHIRRFDRRGQLAHGARMRQGAMDGFTSPTIKRPQSRGFVRIHVDRHRTECEENTQIPH